MTLVDILLEYDPNERYKKLKALVDRPGSSGERGAAIKALNRHVTKHGKPTTGARKRTTSLRRVAGNVIKWAKTNPVKAAAGVGLVALAAKKMRDQRRKRTKKKT